MDAILDVERGFYIEVGGSLIEVRRLPADGMLYAQPVVSPNVSSFKLEFAKKAFLAAEKAITRSRP